jgi:large subunit ribosomal protein L29
MKHQELIKYHQMTIPELNGELNKLSGTFTEAKLKQKLGQEKNVHLVKNLRQDIARLKTIIRQKELANVGVAPGLKVTPKLKTSKLPATAKKTAAKVSKTKKSTKNPTVKPAVKKPITSKTAKTTQSQKAKKE